MPSAFDVTTGLRQVDPDRFMARAPRQMYAGSAAMRDLGRLVLPAALAVCPAACSAILGVEDIVPASGQDGGAEGSSDAAPQSPEGMGTSDAPAEGASSSSSSGSSSGSSTSSGSSSSGSS